MYYMQSNHPVRYSEGARKQTTLYNAVSVYKHSWNSVLLYLSSYFMAPVT